MKSKCEKGKYSQVILTEQGDIIEGFYNKAFMQQTYTNQISQMQQVDLAISLMWDLVKRVARYAAVTYATVASNHCQFRLSGQTVGMLTITVLR